MSDIVGIIVVTYNSSKDILTLLHSIHKQSYNNVRIYIIDNSSTDSTLIEISDFIHETKINIKVYINKENLGFAKGNNIGIKQSVSDGCTYSFILNPDMELDKECLINLINRTKADNNLDIVGPVVLYGDKKKPTIQVYGIGANFKTQKKNILFSNQSLDSSIPEELVVDYVNGGSMLIKNNILKKAGLFEERYFMYNDELDLALRINNLGYKFLVIKSAIVYHHHDWSTRNKKGYYLLYYYGIRNKYLYFKKYRFFNYLIWDLFKEILSIPIKLKWAKRVADIKLVKFYYLGLWRGLRGEIGKTNINFDK
ncbi:MAG: glycosyltransferase family 2 protein [Ignavibacteriales bacterium]|nr:glycosyltransferase family 2 protein [Ignavibacteriales bacterium]